MFKKILKEFLEEKLLREGFDDAGNPDLKYYAFDWDDNIVFMPTEIIVSTADGEEVGMGTEDFAEYRMDIGKEPFMYKGKEVAAFANDPFRNFGSKGDAQFIVDAMLAKPGPSWDDFVECLNGGSIFAIITARGHNPETLKEATYNYIVTNHNGISKQECISNLKKFRNIAEEGEMDGNEIIMEYLNMCKFHPVTFGEGSATNPEEGKIKALREFISYVKEMSSRLGKQAFFKNDVKNRFIPEIGFSDDDPRNIEKIKQFLDTEYSDKPVRTYLTKGGEKKEI
jgi:hypothetical protein